MHKPERQIDRAACSSKRCDVLSSQSSGFVVVHGIGEWAHEPLVINRPIVAGPFVEEGEARDALDALRPNFKKTRLYIGYVPTAEQVERWTAQGLVDDANVETWLVTQGPQHLPVSPLCATEKEALAYASALKPQHSELFLRNDRSLFSRCSAFDMVCRDELLGRMTAGVA